MLLNLGLCPSLIPIGSPNHKRFFHDWTGIEAKVLGPGKFIEVGIIFNLYSSVVVEDDDETVEEICPPREHMPTNLGIPIMFATPEAEVKDHPRIGGEPLDEGGPLDDGVPLDDGEDPPKADEQEMEEPPDVDTTEENLELMPEVDEPLDAIVEDNENEMEMPEMGTKRPRDDDEMTEDSTKRLRTRLKEGITRAWQKAKETEVE